MLGNFSWKQAVCISPHLFHAVSPVTTDTKDTIREDPRTHGAMLIPVNLGSNKTTASVATGQNEFYPLYLTPGNIKNNTRQGHKDVVALVGFLAIPKSMFN